jgi:prepilin-type N-terminal cleavage/methylation domain-containing protein
MSDERGFTLVELLVGIMLMTIVLGAVLTTFDTFGALQQRTSRTNDAQESARRFTDTLARELRNAVGGPGESVERDGLFDIVFLTVGPGAPVAGNEKGRQRVRYCLDSSDPANGKIMRQVQTFAGAPTALAAGATACPLAGWTQSQVVIQNVTNRRGGTDRPLFEYRYSPLDPDAPTSALSRLLAVSPHVYVDHTSAAAKPAETDLATGIQLRNANQPPIPLFSATQQGARLVLNASASADPESASMTYAWYLDGATTNPLTGVRVQTPGLIAGPHTVRLVVTDAAGATATKIEGVTVQ